MNKSLSSVYFSSSFIAGKYVPFGVFQLYNDNCLLTSLEACMTLVLTIPQEQVEVGNESVFHI